MQQWIILALIALTACNAKPYPDESINRFSDPQLVKIYELQDRRESKQLIPFLKAKEIAHRVQAALAFASLQDTMAIPYLAQMILIDQDELPRRAAALALGQIGSDKAAQTLRQAFASELTTENQRVILEAIGRCIDSTSLLFLEKYEPNEPLLVKGWVYGAYRALLKRQFSDEILDRMQRYLFRESAEDEVQIIAANYLFMYYRINPNKEAQMELVALSAGVANVEASLTLARLSGEAEIAASEGNDSLDSYALSEYITDLELTETNRNLMMKQYYAGGEKVVQNACLLKLTEMEKAGSYYPEGFASLVRSALMSADMAQQSIAAYALVDKDLPHAWDFVSLELLDSIKNQLVLPRQKETFIDISKAIAFKQGETFVAEPLPFNNPMDWAFVKSIPRDQQVRISTSKGDIVIQLFVDDAPASVSNILRLIDNGFYDGKYFHRVVDHFVIQGGCPRGDGWGGLDWSQRSEFSNYQHYSEGTVGLASAGKDTEGVQWFITHNATPFLTGRYTIFARVISGMDVVNEVGVGDTIVKVERLP